MMETIIHIEWEGPYSLNQLDTLKDLRKDHGLYQYMGITRSTAPTCSFISARRTGGRLGSGSRNTIRRGIEEDRAHIEIYVGRLKGFMTTQSSDDWRNEINWAEKLLLYVHAPAYNPQHLMELNEEDPRVCGARVLDWGASERYIRKSRVAGGQKLPRMRPTLTRFMRCLDCGQRVLT